MNKKTILKLIVAGVGITIIGFLISKCLGHWISLESLKANKENLITCVNEHYLLTVVCFIACYVGIVAFSVPISSLFTLAGGFLFGPLFGALYSNVGGTLGAVLAFTFFRCFLVDKIKNKYSDHLENFVMHLKKEGPTYVLIMHLATVIPYFLINMFAAAANMPYWQFIWSTFLGVIPGSLVYAFAGSQLLHINSMSDVFSPKVLLAFGLMIGLAFGSMLWKKFKKK